MFAKCPICGECNYDFDVDDIESSLCHDCFAEERHAHMMGSVNVKTRNIKEKIKKKRTPYVQSS